MRQKTERQFSAHCFIGSGYDLPPRIGRASNFEARVVRDRIVNGGNGERGRVCF